MTILSFILVGLFFITLYLIFSKYGSFKLVLTVVVALLFGGYFSVVTQYPKYLGYPIDISLIDMNESRVLSALEGSNKIYLVVVHKDAKEPRLISMDKTEENKKQYQEISKGLKKGAVIVEKGGRGKGLNGEYEEPTGSLKIIPITEQTIMKKDSP